MNWTAEQQALIDTYQSLEEIPEEQREYTCNACKLIIKSGDLVDGKCPACNSSDALVQRCPLDTDHDCGKVHATGFEKCPICGNFICPECGNHQVDAISRITGYLSPVKAWNHGKSAELSDRRHYNIV